MKIWKVAAKYNPSESLAKQILHTRGISDETSFIAPKNPLLLTKDFEKDFKTSLLLAKKLILESIDENKSILIYGDYDADGVCATSILYRTFRDFLKYKNIHYFIPNRFEHGYGISNKSIEYLQKNNIVNNTSWLLISVDTGITAVPEVAALKSKGVSVIVTDHHQKPEVLPSADIIIWNDKMVGASIAWVLSETLGNHDPLLKAYASIATVTDLQPLLGFNRALVKDGIEILNSQTPKSIRKIIESAGRNTAQISTYDMGFVIGPRLNAGGRMTDAQIPLKLLISDSDSEIQNLSNELNNVNSQRQDKTLEMFEKTYLSTHDTLPKFIVSSSADYHEGIIGLVASKVTQKYYRPSAIICTGEGISKGSVRSIPGIDIISVLRKFDELFENLGGHPMAAGFSIKNENISKMEKQVNEYISKTFAPETFIPVAEADLELSFRDISVSLVKEIDVLKPFGIGNKEPYFATYNVKVVSMNKVGKDAQHLSLKLSHEGVNIKGIFFNSGDTYDKLFLGINVDILYSLKESEFNGFRSIDAIISELKYEG